MRAIQPLVLGALLVSACDLGEPIQLSPPQPTLVILQGNVTVPDGYKSPVVRLYTADGVAIAAGTVIPDENSYNVCIAPGTLDASASLYQVSLKEGDLVIYSAPVRLQRDLSYGTQDINSATTAVWLAAAEYRAEGKDPLQWNFPALLDNPTVKDVAGKLETEVAQWSKDHQSHPLSDEIQGEISNIVAVASKV